MDVFVKICGLTSAKDVAAVGAIRPDAIGFVFWPGSPRCVNASDVARWTQSLPPWILRVGVFVDETPAGIRAACREAGLDVVQLHGMEPPAHAAAAGTRVWRAAAPDTAFDPGPWIEAGIEAFLLDAPGGPMPGGTGRTCNWETAANAVRRLRRPALLAGGLNPDNVADAIRRVAPWGVDVSSGVEQAPGRKDLDLVRRFIAQCRGHEGT